MVTPFETATAMIAGSRIIYFGEPHTQMRLADALAETG